MGQMVTREERARRRTRRDEVVEEATADIKRSRPSPAPPSALGTVVVNPQQELLHGVRQAQMARGAAALTKADLVAILCRLTRATGDMAVATYQQLSCEDLRVAIRLELYAPQTASRLHDTRVRAAIAMERQAAAAGPAALLPPEPLQPSAPPLCLEPSAPPAYSAVPTSAKI